MNRMTSISFLLTILLTCFFQSSFPLEIICQDANFPFPVGTKSRKCTDASTAPFLCNNQKFKVKCPVTCELCECKDSTNTFFAAKKQRVCSDATSQKFLCKIRTTKVNCPVTCKLCEPTDVGNNTECSDSTSSFTFGGKVRTCTDAKTKPFFCTKAKFQQLCPVTCDNCPDDGQPSMAPSKPPSATPTDYVANPGKVIQDVRKKLEELVAQNPILKPKFVRLGFHDCVGGCDGCVDLGNPDNNGLNIPIDALESLVAEYERDGVTRADIWALAATVGVAKSQDPNDALPYSFHWYGRTNCEDNGFTCPVSNPSCDPSRTGPDQALPSSHLTTSGILHFFFEEFGFSDRETAALMGVHSIGTASRQNSGFDGPNGWVFNNKVLSNGYYDMLIGGLPDKPLSETTFEELYHAPLWTQLTVDNSDLVEIPDQIMWNHTKKIDGPDDNRDPEMRIMLNSDIALVRDFSNHFDANTGEVTCLFRSRRPADLDNLCPHAVQTFDYMAEFKFDNSLWLSEFRNVFQKMLVHGFDDSSGCTSPPCAFPTTDERNLFSRKYQH